jgi:ATP-dependent Lhr-like helicase
VVQGRWSLTSSLFLPEPDPGLRRRTVAELLLERYGIVTREQVLAEGIPGGFSILYDALSSLETLGVCRRGYFVEGLGGAQFALPGAVERLRAQQASDEAPHVVLAGAEPIVYVEKGGRGLLTLVDPADPRLHPALEALAAFVLGGRGRKLALEKIDGEPVVGSDLEPLLIELGFRQGPRKLTLSA